MSKTLIALTISILWPFSIKCQSLLNKTFESVSSFEKSDVITSPKDLLQISKNAQNYLKNKKAKTDNQIKSILFKDRQTYLASTQNTLSSLISILKTNPETQINQDVLNQHFRYIKWNGNTEVALKNKVYIPNGKIRLTKYLVFRISGSYVKTNKFSCALYDVPKDEQQLSEKEILNKKNSLIRFKYTKQDVLSDALEKSQNKRLVKPLVWLTREDLEEAIMQGTTIVQTPDNKKHIFNVHKSNEIPYDKKLKSKILQKRYWYFKEVSGFQGYGKDFASRIQIIPEVTFAGDVHKLGVGTIIAIVYNNPKTFKKESRIGIIADCGGAFENNLYQLDYFVGAFKSREDFKNKIVMLPEMVDAYILVKK
ncbi:MltA domain-containing protein [Candidatus Babeliales bacterium]|nr:MltA domain-containing protein [Candidatus Babeliales bacterium]